MRASSLLLAPLLLLYVTCCVEARRHSSGPAFLRWWPGPKPDPVANVEHLAQRLYGLNDLTAIDEFCAPGVVVHGDGIWLPRTSFEGVEWVKQIHSEWFRQFTGWKCDLLEIASSTAAVKGFTDVFAFFHWRANNTGAYQGFQPSLLTSWDYSVLHAVTDKAGKVTDVTLRRAGFQEERGGLLREPRMHDEITRFKDITQQPFWIPSPSLQLRMAARAHAVLEVLNQGEKFVDSLDDLCTTGVVLVDGSDVWGPWGAAGVLQLKAWMAGWLGRYDDVNAAVTGSAVTVFSNKVLMSFKLQLTDSSGAAPLAIGVEGTLLYVFNIQGYITHVVVWRSGTPDEARERLLGGGLPDPGGGVAVATAAREPALLGGELPAPGGAGAMALDGRGAALRRPGQAAPGASGSRWKH